jgi:hypothetical protein
MTFVPPGQRNDAHRPPVDPADPIVVLLIVKSPFHSKLIAAEANNLILQPQTEAGPRENLYRRCLCLQLSGSVSVECGIKPTQLRHLGINQ